MARTWRIGEVAERTGLTRRTLRHYDAIGLLPAGRGAGNGYRTYRADDLVRLQRILLLRDLGLGLPDIARVLDGRSDNRAALRSHLAFLRREQERIDRQIASVEATIEAITKETTMTADEMFDGFDHTQYREEVEQRWGKEEYSRSDRWWKGIGQQGRQAFMEEAKAIGQGWAAARESGEPVDAPEVRALAARHIAWIGAGWGGVQPNDEQILGLAQMYVDDERFAANYGGAEGAAYVRDALTSYVRGR